MASKKLKTAAAGQSRNDATSGVTSGTTARIAAAHPEAAESTANGDGRSVSSQERTAVIPPGEMTAEDAATRELMVAQAAYYRAQLRDFAPGAEWQDWFEAEQAIDGARQASWTA